MEDMTPPWTTRCITRTQRIGDHLRWPKGPRLAPIVVSMPHYRTRREASAMSTNLVSRAHVSVGPQGIARSASSRRGRSLLGLSVERNGGPPGGSTPARWVTYRAPGRPHHPPVGRRFSVASVTKKALTDQPIGVPGRGIRQAGSRPYSHPTGTDHQVVGVRRGRQ